MSAKWYTRISLAMRVRGESGAAVAGRLSVVVAPVSVTGVAIVRELVVVIGEGNPLVV